MHKILTTAGVTLALVMFGLQNSDHVPVSFIVGSPTKIRLIFLLAIAGTCGFLLSYVMALRREIRLKKEIRRLTFLHRSERPRLIDQHADDLGDA